MFSEVFVTELPSFSESISLVFNNMLESYTSLARLEKKKALHFISLDLMPANHDSPCTGSSNGTPARSFSKEYKLQRKRIHPTLLAAKGSI